MSTVPPPPTLPPSPPTPSFGHTPQPLNQPPSSGGPSRSSEIKLVSHSNLFYWWPVWAMAFLMAAITWVDGSRMAVVPSGSTFEWVKDESGKPTNRAALTVPPTSRGTASLNNAAGYTADNAEKNQSHPVFGPRVTERVWPGAIFVVGLIVTIIVTNVPLRGLWSFLVIIMVVVVALTFALLNIWDDVFRILGGIHIHMNMAAYLTIGVVVFAIWALATFLFDQRSFVIFTPGQIRYCEHVGAAVQAFPTGGVSLEKQRDDLFRHYIFGLGSGDLIIKRSMGENREIRMPNVLFLGWRISKVEDILRSVATT